MARLQDFPIVTPTSSDKLLVVQSQGQGLVPYGSKLDSANPTGTGTLTMTGNGVFSGDLTYKGNQALSSMLMSYKFKSGSPITLTVNRYTTLLVIGFAQRIGSIGLMVVIAGATLSSVINLATATAFSSTHLTFSLSNNVLTIASDDSNESVFTIVRGS